VAKTVRSGYDNAQLLTRIGEGNSFIQQEEHKRNNEVVPVEPKEFGADMSDEAMRKRMYLGRRIFAAEEQRFEQGTDPSYYNADGGPKTIAQLKAEVVAIESCRFSAMHAIEAHKRPPMSKVVSNNLQSEGSGGVGKVEEGLFSMGNTHGQPPHEFGNAKVIDKRFARPRDIPADDHPSVQGNILRSISRLADSVTRSAIDVAEHGSEEREVVLQAERAAYNEHMTFKYKHKL
jgi:hypothetical protein